MMIGAQLYWIATSGSKTYVLDSAWAHEADAKKARCPVCKGVIVKNARSLDSIIVERKHSAISIGFVFSFWGGVVLRDDVATFIGLEYLLDKCHVIPLEDSRGKTIGGFSYYCEKDTDSTLRAGDDSQIRVCGECGRLMYSVGREPYLLKQYLPEDRNVSIHGGLIFCDDYFLKMFKEKKGFGKLVVTPVGLREVPNDKLSGDYDEMISEIRLRKWIYR